MKRVFYQEEGREKVGRNTGKVIRKRNAKTNVCTKGPACHDALDAEQGVKHALMQARGGGRNGLYQKRRKQAG